MNDKLSKKKHRTLNKLQMTKLTNLNAIKGGDAETKTGKNNTKTKSTNICIDTKQGGA